MSYADEVGGRRELRLRALLASGALAATRSQDADERSSAHDGAARLIDAQRLFYSARYEAAADVAFELCGRAGLEELAPCELHTSALLFQIRRSVGEAADKRAAWTRCARCPELAAAFDDALQRSRTRARSRLRMVPGDTEARFHLGKLNLNYVWLHTGTLGRRTGWAEYREARASISEVLEQEPGHVRARVARAWMDYIVGTEVPRGVRWLLGGGNRARGVARMREAAALDAGFAEAAEADFGLWDMQVREGDIPGALVTAQGLLADFPENPEVARFLARHGAGGDHAETTP
jgi:hypothetical protein